MKDNLQQRLSAFEAPPPADAWPRIAAALDEENLARRLEGFAPPPPPATWERIAKGLDEQVISSPPATVRRLRPWSLAAAAVLLLLAGGLYLGLRDGSEPTRIVQETAPPPPTLSGRDTAQTTTLAPSESAPTVVTAAAGSGLRPIIERIAQRAGLADEPIEPHPSSLLSFGEVSVQPMAMIPEEAVRPQTIAYPMPPERYLIYSDDEGRAMRMPCRLYDMIACGERDDACRQQLARLQQQAAMSSGLTTDFTGMLELIRRLGENQ